MSVRLSNIGSTKTGINMTAVRDMGRIIKEASQADPVRVQVIMVVFTMRLKVIHLCAFAGEADVVINATRSWCCATCS